MAEEKTEQGTPKRREEAKRKGQVARSREIPSVMTLMAGLSVLYFLSTHMLRQLSALMVHFFSDMGSFPLEAANMQALGFELARELALIVGPVLLAVAAAAILSNVAQVRGIFSAELVKPDLSKISPLKGLGRICSAQAFVDLAKSVFKILIVGGVAYYTVRGEIPRLLPLADRDAGGILSYVGSVSFTLFVRTALVMFALAALDYFYQRWSFEKSIRMTRQELKEEYKQTEGDPLVKSRIRSVQRDLARKRMMADVPKADVIITNPTHLAVALRYAIGEMEAPKVIAKGAGAVAEKIKEIGRAHAVPILENKPLAQALFKTVEIGQMIPADFYQAVADILAYVYKMKRKTL
jgi:flagellar biosynthetic protein FlhB